MKQGVPQPITWPISGNHIHHKDFLQRLQASWRDKTNSKYGSSFTRWTNWCQQWGRNLLCRPIADIVIFLADLFSQGYQYHSLNCYRSAILSVHEAVDGLSVGVHPAVTRLLKGVFNARPPLPRYSAFWDVGTVITHLKNLGDNSRLHLKQLTLKTTVSLVLTRPSCSADLAKLNTQWMSYQTDGVTIRLAHLAKQSRSSKHMADFFVLLVKEDTTICPLVTLRVYEDCTKEFRGLQSPNPKTKLFLTWIGNTTL